MTSLDRINVLYVDDDKQLLEVIKELLECDDRIKVDVCDSVSNAFRILESKTFDIIISDFQMPGADGIEFLKKLRFEGIDTPFILFTGKGREEIAIEALNNGAYAYLQKGMDIGVIGVQLNHNIKEGYNRSKALKDIIASERRGWALLDLMNGPCLLADRTLKIVATNNNLAEFFGIEKESILGCNIGDLVPSVIKVDVMTAVEKTRMSKTPYKMVLSQSNSFSEMNFYPIMSDRGELDRIAILTHDITGLVKNENELKKRLEMEKMVSSISSKLITETADGFELSIESSLRTLGIHLGVERVYFDVARKDDGSLVMSKDVFIDGGTSTHISEGKGYSKFQYFSKKLSSGEPVIVEDVDLIPPEGAAEKEELLRTGTRSILLIPITMSDQSIGVLGIVDKNPRASWSEGDIASLKVIGDLLSSFVLKNESDRKIREGYELTKESERKLRSYLSNLPGMAYTCKNDKDWTMECLSEGCKDLTGYDASELLQRKVSYESIIHKDDRLFVRTEIQKSIDSKQMFKLSYRLITKAGNIKWVEERGRIIFGSDRKLQCVEGIITELPVATKSIVPRNSSPVVDPILSVAREDIMDQVMILNGHLSMLKKNPRDLASAERMEKMSRTLRRVQDNLNFAHEYKDSGPSEKQWVDLQRIAEEASASVWYKKFTVTIELDGIEVFAAEPMIKKVVTYLVENSAFHGENVSSVALSSSLEGERLKIVYEDNGKGIPDSEKEDIFIRGYGKNTGFSLFLCKEILGMYGIGMVENGRYGDGMRFEISVPPGKFLVNAPKQTSDMKGAYQQEQMSASDDCHGPKVYIEFGK